MAPPIILSQTFAALRHENYRTWFIGQLFSLIGTWMQSAAQGFLIYELTHSSAYLGYVGFIGGLPSLLFTIFGGVIADRIPRRTMLIITQTTMMVMALILAALTFSGVVAPWHILVLAFLLGIANAFDAPARQSFVVELVDREDMTNAISLNAVLFNSANVLGPAFGGLIYAWVGPGWCFTINGISFVAVIIALLLIHLPDFVPTVHNNVMTELREGFRFVRGDYTIQLLLLTVGMVSVFGFSLITLIPAWSTEILKGDVRTNGLLLSARGAGAMIGALTLASLAGYKSREKLWTAGIITLPLSMILFSFVRIIPLSLLVLVVIGGSMIMLVNSSNALVQHRLPDHLRGRVMGIYTMIFMGGQPLGSLSIGWLATAIGEPTALKIFATLLLVFAVWINLRHREIRSEPAIA